MEFSPQQVTGGIRDPASQRMRILVIDDDACVGVAIQSLLASRRCDTVIASRACAGIHALQRSAFDILMIDIFMPGLSGLDTIEHIRRGSAVPIIAMSGFRLRNSTDSVDYLGMAERRGATLCMRKPFTPSQLVEAIERSRNLVAPIEGSRH